MNRYIHVLLVSILMISCNQDNKYLPAKDPLVAGREFIDASLKGKFEKADFFMLQDEENKRLLQKIAEQYSKVDNAKLKQLTESSIVIIDFTYVTEKETVINYKYSFDGYVRKIKVIQQSTGNWVVDFKYANNGNL